MTNEEFCYQAATTPHPLDADPDFAMIRKAQAVDAFFSPSLLMERICRQQ